MLLLHNGTIILLEIADQKAKEAASEIKKRVKSGFQ